MGTEYTRVGFIGLGAMGKHMVEQLALKLPSEAQIYVYDVVEAAIDDIVARYPGRMVRATSPRNVAENSKYVLSMVPEGSHVKSVYIDETNGISACNDLDGRILIDCSTIDIATSLAVKDHFAAQHPRTNFYDAPVSGGTLGAAKGTIAFFLGCAESDPNIHILTDLLRLMGAQVIPCGAPSLGISAKLCNNYLSGLIAIAGSEALNMGIKSGLDPRVLSRVFAAGTAQNAICDRFNPCPGIVLDAPSSKDYKGGFKVQLMKKDFSLAVDLAESVGARLMLGQCGLKTYQDASEDPQCCDRDSRVVFRYIGGDEKWTERFGSEG